MIGTGKLYALTSESCALPLHAARDRVSRMPANDIPQLFWPDGTICWSANLFLLHGFRRGRSRRNKGGTLLAWAKNLSHLLRYCASNRVDFLDLSDSHFRMFVNILQSEKDPDNPGEKRRTPEHVGYICGTVLNFLAFLDAKCPGANLLGPTGRIRAELKSYSVPSRTTGAPLKRSAWTHDAVPRQRKSRRRLPISTPSVDKLYEANARLRAPIFVERRRFVMLRLLEITGGRRIEIAGVRLPDIDEAERTGSLRLSTAKAQRQDASRFVPVTSLDIKDIRSFVRHYRQKIIRETIGHSRDHGYLFVGMDSGQPLKVDTLGSEFSMIRREAGISDDEACMHAFRHRFITKIFRDLINTHRLRNESDLRRALLSTETLKLKVMEWTGHRNIDSLDHYIHLAFEAEAHLKETFDVIRAVRVVESLATILEDFVGRLRAAPSRVEFVQDICDSVSTAALELRTAVKGAP